MNARWLWSDAWALAVRQMRFNLRIPVWIGVNLTQPVIWLLLYGQLFRRVVELPGFGAGSYLSFLTPGVAMMTALFGSVWAGFSLIEDFDRGTLDRFLTTPVERGGIVLGSVLATSATVAVQSLIILGLGLLFGATGAGGLTGDLALLVAALLLAAGFSALSNALALLTRKEEPLIAIINFLTLPLAFLSSAIMAPGLMPSWMRTLAQYNPVEWAVEMARQGFGGRAIAWGADGGRLLGFGILMYLFSLLAFRIYRRST